MEENKISEWNMADATLKRMDFILTEIYKAWLVRDGVEWYNQLRALHRELYPFMKTKERNATKNLINGLVKEYNIISNNPKGFKISPMFSEKLDELDLFLRSEMDERGLLMKRSRDPAKSLAMS